MLMSVLLNPFCEDREVRFFPLRVDAIGNDLPYPFGSSRGVVEFISDGVNDGCDKCVEFLLFVGRQLACALIGICVAIP